MDKLNYLLKYLLSENLEYRNIAIPESTDDRFALFRSLVNIRAPKPISEEYLAAEDEFLREMTAQKGITDYRDLTPVKPRVAGRYHNAEMRRGSKRGKLGNAGLLLPVPRLY